MRLKTMKKAIPKKAIKKNAGSKNSKPDETDYKRLAAMTDEDIDFSDIPKAAPEMFAHAVVRRNFKVLPRKQQLTLLVDSDVLWWFLKQGAGYEERMSAVLRAYVEEQTRN